MILKNRPGLNLLDTYLRLLAKPEFWTILGQYRLVRNRLIRLWPTIKSYKRDRAKLKLFPASVLCNNLHV